MSRAAALELVRSGSDAAALTAFEHAHDWHNVSVMLARQHRYPEALDAALRIPDKLRSHCQAMAVCWEAGDQDGIKLHLNAGLAIDPENADLRTARAAYRLARKDWDGWEDIEYRPWAKTLRESCDEFPEWNGRTPLKGQRLLVIYQDGHGDRVMYSRFLHNLWAQEPARLVFYCTPETVRLFAEAYPFAEVVSSDLEIGDVDMWIGLSSLGKCRFPIDGRPYLTVLGERKRRLAARFKQNGNLRVGLVWAGNAKHTQDHTRSKPFSEFMPLLSIEGVDFYSLQFEEHNLDHGGRLNELSIYCLDTADTLAAIANLDLVIGVDTGMIHFAGALGVPAWVLCYTPIDWRWGVDGHASYWYDWVSIERNPTMSSVHRRLSGHAAVARRRSVGEKISPILAATTFTAPCRYGMMTGFSNDLWCSRSLQEYGEWSQGEVDLLLQVLEHAPWYSRVVEAGAHIGAHTLPLAQYLAERDGRLMAFEPWLEACSLLRRNVQRCGLDNVWCWDNALGAVEEDAFLNPPDMDQVQAAGTVEIVYSGQQKVKVLPLDNWKLPRLDLLKADVEASEIAVLEGAEQTIRRCRPVLYLENHYPEKESQLILLMDHLGYRVYEHRIPLFNPSNFRGNKLNIFGTLESKMLLGVPKERYDLRGVTKGLMRVRVKK